MRPPLASTSSQATRAERDPVSNKQTWGLEEEMVHMWAVVAEGLSSIPVPTGYLPLPVTPAPGMRTPLGPELTRIIMPSSTQNTNTNNSLEPARQAVLLESHSRWLTATSNSRGFGTAFWHPHSGTHRHTNKNRSKKTQID